MQVDNQAHSTNASSNSATEDVRNLGYWDGAHTIPPDGAQQRIRSEADGRMANLRHHSTKRVEALRAELLALGDRLPAAQRLWADARERFGEHPPAIALPLLYLFFSFTSLLGDAVLLAPALDMFSISNRSLQYAGALFLALLAAAALGFIFDHDLAPLLRWVVRGVAVIALAFQITLGFLRARELEFASGLAASPVSAFLSAHHLLNGIFFVAISLLVPIIAAVALHVAVQRLRSRRQWMRARREQAAITARMSALNGELRQETESLPHRLDQVQHESDELRGLYSTWHELGQRRDPAPSPQWLVVLKALAAAALTLAILTLAGISPLTTVAAAACAGLAGFAWWEQRRIHPTPTEFRKTHRPHLLREPQPLFRAVSRASQSGSQPPLVMATPAREPFENIDARSHAVNGVI